VTTYDFRYAPTYADCIRSYTRRADVLASLQLALAELATEPFGNPRLQTHAMKRAPDGTYTSHVGSLGHRLIWRLVGRVIVLLFGEHDAVYRRAQRLRLEIDDTQNVIRVFDEDPGTDRELADLGFGPQEITVLRRLDDEDALLGLEGRMRDEAWTRAANLVMYGRPDGEAAAREGLEEPVVEGGEVALVDPVEEQRRERALRDERAAREFVPVAADELAQVLVRPIEDWMVYLDPSQRSLAERSFSGPARIRGAAGTGKTVVGLHRARALAAQGDGGRVLVTTFVNNLPPVYEQLFRRLAPEVADRVEFKNVHKWAMALLYRNRVAMNVDLGLVGQAWKRACDAVLAPGSPLVRAGLTRAYLKDEVDWLIKGRGLSGLERYLALQRSGRGTPLGAAQREAVWQLYQRYEHELRARRGHDFNDILLMALDLVRDRGIDPPYHAVIVDEAQDLTEVAIRLLHAAAGGDTPNGLLLVGDGQQSVYPGGFSLASLGINVRGRSYVLTRNYRNTRQVLAAAAAVVADDSFDDGEDALERGRRMVEVTRDGPQPHREAFENLDDHDVALCAAIEAAVGAGTGAGDLAVLVPTNALVAEYAGRISGLGLTTQKLE